MVLRDGPLIERLRWASTVTTVLAAGRLTVPMARDLPIEQMRDAVTGIAAATSMAWRSQELGSNRLTGVCVRSDGIREPATSGGDGKPGSR